MSKRFVFQQQNGDRKRPKLDVSISDHNFPLSQNAAADDKPENWADDNEDEMLLLASQACEDVCLNESMLPNYSMCMQPVVASTQINPKVDSFSFKKPNYPRNQDYNRISSPLPGMSSKMEMNIPRNVSDDLIISEKVCKNQGSDYMYKQLVQLQEEISKLKSENCKLLDKCVTKEGEATILRTQLKTSQIAVDSARIEKIKAQEKMQIEWNEKLALAKNEILDLKNQLDFKNLEIVNVKERHKVLESSKLKLTQVSVSTPSNDLNRTRNGFYNNGVSAHKKVPVNTVSAQTDDKSHFVKLIKRCSSAESKLSKILPSIQKPTTDQISILDYNDKLHTNDSFTKRNLFTTFRIPSSPSKKVVKVRTSHVGEHVAMLCTDCGVDEVRSRCDSILNQVILSLELVLNELQNIKDRITNAFQKDMDEKYIESTHSFKVLTENDLLSDRMLYNEEQGINARRLLAVLSYILDENKCAGYFQTQETIFCMEDKNLFFLIERICELLSVTSCSILYSGLLLSILFLIKKSVRLKRTIMEPIVKILRIIIASRPNAIVCYEMLNVLNETGLRMECTGSGNVKVDYDQGVLLFVDDTCHVQVLLKQLEIALSCMEREKLFKQYIQTGINLVRLSYQLDVVDKRCACQQIFNQVFVYSLYMCSSIFHDEQSNLDRKHISNLKCICIAGIMYLYQCVMRDIEFISKLKFNEGYYQIFVENCDKLRPIIVSDEIHGTMLNELMATLQPIVDDLELPSSQLKQVWLDSFNKFSISQ